MQFLNKNESQKNNNVRVMRMASFARSTPIVNEQPPSPEPNPNVKKMEWGEPTWFLFHTLAEKVKPGDFDKVRLDLLNMIYNICNNLPCPTCAQHATDYIKTSQFFKIKTKEELKTFLYVFHNSINKKKGFPIFDYNDLTNKYISASTRLIIYNFIAHYQKKNKNMKTLINDMHRTRLINSLKTWFLSTIIYFDE